MKDAEGQPVDVTFAPGADYDPAAIDTTIPLVVMSGDLVSGDEYTFELDMLDGAGAPCTASFIATYNAS